MTPIFSRIWLVKMQQVRALEISEVSLRMAALISRACAPTVESPISPSSSCFRDKGRDGIEHDDVERVRAHERLDNPKRFLAGARLRDEQIVHVDAEPARVLRIERVLDIDERRQAAALLRLGDDGERERGFAGGFRAVNFDDAAAREIRRRRARDRSGCCR